MKKVIAFFVMCSIACMVIGAENNTIWESDFSQSELGKPVAGFSPRCTLKEEGGKRFLAFLRQKPPMHVCWLISGAQKNSAKWMDYELTFEVKFNTANNTISAIVNKQGAKPDLKYIWYYVDISKKGLRLRCHGTKNKYEDCKYSDAKLSNLKSGEWYKFSIRVSNSTKNIEVFREQEGKMVKTASWDNIARAGGGFNFYITCSLDIANLKVISLQKKKSQ